MSRRFNIGIINKNKHKKIKDLSLKELKLQYGDKQSISLSNLSNEVFCIGKDFDDSFLKPFAIPAFSSKVHNAINKEDRFYIINKEGFQALIEYFRQKIANNFKELLGDPKQSNKAEDDARFSYIYFRLQERDNNFNIKPYNLEKEFITNSSTPEYAIFELIRIYKTINWKTQLICISAW
jgi:hypothetical protein